jgi:hypothetical protein
MEITPNNNIKIVRLQSGEDIVADMIEDNDNDVVMLNNPMHIIFKRIPTGQTVMMMMPWLPIELIKENAAVIYTSDILTVIDPKQELVNYYGNVVTEAQLKMQQHTSLDTDYEDDVDEEEDDDEASMEEILEAMNEQKKHNIH